MSNITKQDWIQSSYEWTFASNKLSDVIEDRDIWDEIVDEYLYLLSLNCDVVQVISTQAHKTALLNELQKQGYLEKTCLMPIYKDEHWILIAIDVAKRSLVIYDSLDAPIEAYIDNQLRGVYNYLRQMSYKDCDAWDHEVRVLERQTDVGASGVHLCRTAKFLAGGGRFAMQPWVSSQNERYRLLYELVYGTLLLGDEMPSIQS